MTVRKLKHDARPPAPAPRIAGALAGRRYAHTPLHALADHLDLSTVTAETDDAIGLYLQSGFRAQPAQARHGRAQYACTVTRR
ncbi:hypothetical protein [Deinococcus yunweiensis]|uniref:hypothetical protein n=1 Tax=Deinococcus yunweiensis TaxID=367282 RepID=UPI00398EB38B